MNTTFNNHQGLVMSDTSNTQFYNATPFLVNGQFNTNPIVPTNIKPSSSGHVYGMERAPANSFPSLVVTKSQAERELRSNPFLQAPIAQPQLNPFGTPNMPQMPIQFINTQDQQLLQQQQQQQLQMNFDQMKIQSTNLVVPQPQLNY